MIINFYRTDHRTDGPIRSGPISVLLKSVLGQVLVPNHGLMVQTGPFNIPTAGANGNTVIPAHNVHVDEDWSLAGGCAVDAGTATNAPNGATNNNNHIVLPDINIRANIGQTLL